MQRFRKVSKRLESKKEKERKENPQTDRRLDYLESLWTCQTCRGVLYQEINDTVITLDDLLTQSNVRCYILICQDVLLYLKLETILWG